jgi:hypothetical protein
MEFIVILLIAYPILAYLSLRGEGRKITQNPDYDPSAAEVTAYAVTSLATAIAVTRVANNRKRAKMVKRYK